jgi:ubiquinone/menaquinone biosynthesis C-methylase UbiE
MPYTGYQALCFSVYEYLAKEFSSFDEWTFLNYGYANLDEQPESHNQNHFQELYAQVAGSISLDGLNILEIGCGRGGGAAYVSSVCHPKSFVGIDFSPQNIRFCSNNHSMEALQFVNAEASDLPFHSETFDATINIESSHGYQDESKFFQSASRVLKPGGHFLFADFRLRHILPDLRRKIADVDLNIIIEKDITENVLHALNLDSPRMRTLIRTHFPIDIQSLLLESTAVTGTTKHALFAGGFLRYVQIVATKAATRAV